jgi:hypothetical protein
MILIGAILALANLIPNALHGLLEDGLVGVCLTPCGRWLFGSIVLASLEPLALATCRVGMRRIAAATTNPTTSRDVYIHLRPLQLERFREVDWRAGGGLVDGSNIEREVECGCHPTKTTSNQWCEIHEITVRFGLLT